MPLGKYYCDYCDKEFPDTPTARRRHLQGALHQRAKALWYDSLRYANQVPDPELLGKKGVCNCFVRTGSCPYGHSCKYYHPKMNVQNPNVQRISGTSDNVHSQNFALPGRERIQQVSFSATHFMGEDMGNSWGNLPPSLRPPSEGGYPPLLFIDWG